MYKKRRQKKKIQDSALVRELRNYEREGTHLYLENLPSRPGEIAEACLLAENSEYMWDYVSDESGRITEIHFIRISEGSEL